MRLRDRACGSLSPKLEDSSVLPSHRKRSRRRKSRRLEAGGSVAGGSSEGRHRQALLLSGVAFGLAAAAALRHSRPASPHSVTLIRREERVCVFAFAPFPPLLIFSTDILRSSPLNQTSYEKTQHGNLSRTFVKMIETTLRFSF